MPANVRAAVGQPIRAAGGAAKLLAAEGGGLRRFAGVAYTGAPMRPMGWGIPIICDLAGFKFPASQHRPSLHNHDSGRVVGHTDGITVGDKGVEVTGPFSGEKQFANAVTEPADNGFQWQMSIGATPVRIEFLEAGKTATVNGREVTGPMDISRETELSEVSFVPNGADGDTSAVVASQGGRVAMFKAMLKTARSAGNVHAAKYSDEDVEKMSDDEAKAALKKCMAEGDDDKPKDDPKAKAADDDADEKKDAKDAKAAAERRLQAQRTADADEVRRVSSIKARVAKFAGINASKVRVDAAGRPSDTGTETTVDLIPYAIEHGWSAAEAELEARRNDRPQGPHFHTPNAPVLNEAVLECAVFDALGGQFKLFDKEFYQRDPESGQRRVSAAEERRITADLNGRYTDQVRQAAHTHFRGGLGLQQLLTRLAGANGYRGPETFGASGWSEVANHLSGYGRGFQADGPSTINVPGTLANVQNKLLLQGYLFTEQAFMKVGQVIPVKDLKPTKSVQLFGDFQFQPLNTSGEMQHGSVGDNPYANQAALYARMITIPLTYIINDDLNAFGQVPMMLGRGWGLAVNDKFWSVFMNPGNDEGGSTAFWAATHTITGQSGNSNYQSGGTTALSSASLAAAEILFNNQVDPAGKPLGVDPELLVFPSDLKVTATELMNAQFILMAGLASTAAASKQPNTNIWQGRFDPVMSRYLNKSAYTGYSTTAWYMLANPAVLPVIQIAALNGQMAPTVQTAGQDWQFNTLGISMRGWGGFGVNAQNFRGGVKSAGA